MARAARHWKHLYSATFHAYFPTTYLAHAHNDGCTAGGLNPSQAAAVKAALTRTLTVWQGPPGTGKTSTLLHFMRIAHELLPKGDQILATAASNVAVDALVAGLLQHGIKVVRVGQPAKVSVALFARPCDQHHSVLMSLVISTTQLCSPL